MFIILPPWERTLRTAVHVSVQGKPESKPEKTRYCVPPGLDGPG